MDLNIRIAGEAGQGIQTTGDLLVAALAAAGLHVFSTQSYMSRIRGGLNWYDIRIADRELFSGTERADLLVALTEEALVTLRPEVAPQGVVLLDGAGGEDTIGIDFTGTAKELTGSDLMANSVAAGAVFALLGYDLAPLRQYLEKTFSRKGAEVVEANLRCAERGAELAAGHGSAVTAPEPVGAPETVYSGTEAVGLAAATAGVKLAAAYPMTPSTGVFTYLANAAEQYGIVVEQAEDEIAAVNMICGATYAGVPAMATTSGGGFALMVEGLSLAGMLELPILIMLSQRPGPATGLPTRTAQQDLRFAISAGHGEFPRAIYAPGSAEQAYELTRVALETAHRYQSPAILMTDQFLVDQRKNMAPLDDRMRPIERHIVSDPPEGYVRYAVTEDGVSPRAIPGSNAFVVLDSDEHTEDGHITENLEESVRLQDKRRLKEQGMLADFLPPEVYGADDAEVLLVCWGSTWGPCREAVELLEGDGMAAAMAHFGQVWPIDPDVTRKALGLGSSASDRRIICVEGNATGQLASVLRERGVLEECELITRYDGLPFTGEELAARVRS